MSLATLTPPEVIPAPRELIAVTIMQAVAEPFPAPASAAGLSRSWSTSPSGWR